MNLSNSHISWFYKVLAILFILTVGCSKDDDINNDEGVNGFYSNALKSANPSQLSGVWAIHQVSYQGSTADVPVTYEDCGRDFFQFIEDGTYREYIHTTSYECEKEIIDSNWDLEDGIITFSDEFSQSWEIVITELTASKLVFKVQLDIDEDGETDVVSLMAKPHAPPNDPDLYSYTFGPAPIESSDDKIKLTWQDYSGFYDFDRYEVYRSKNGCNKTSAELVGTITDASVNFFIDENPPAKETICYFLKMYNEKGLLAESQVIEYYTEYLRPEKMEFSDISANANTINLNWLPYQGNYFSHYQITVRNYTGGTGYGYQEYPVKTIEDQEITSYVDENPPYLKNPVYAIYAYDIFGNSSSEPYTDDNSWELEWSHPAVLNFDHIQFAVPGIDFPTVYMYGKESNNQYNLVKYDYDLQQISAAANKVPNVSTSINMRLYNTENGQELFFPQGHGLSVYEAETLSFKYNLVTERSFSDFVYLGNNIFAFSDSETIYTYKRTNGNLELVDQAGHFSNHYGNSNYHLILLENRKIVVGNINESKSYRFSVDERGFISDKELVDIPVKSRWEKQTLYSEERDYIINLAENKIYSTVSNDLKSSFEEPYFPSNISRNGNMIFGTNNDPEWNLDNESIHEREAKAFNLTTNHVTSFSTKGYPHFLFENHRGELISVSSGFKRRSLNEDTPRPDIFVEKVQ